MNAFGGATPEELEESYQYLMNANPSTRARLRELLDGYDKMLDSRISALSALSVKEGSLRKNVQFEKREARHDFMAKMHESSAPSHLNTTSSLAHRATAASSNRHFSIEDESAVLDGDTQAAFDKAKRDVKKMFQLVKQHDARKLEQEQRREKRKRYGRLLHLDITNADEELGSVADGGLVGLGDAHQQASVSSFSSGLDMDGSESFFSRHGSTLSAYFTQSRAGGDDSDDSSHNQQQQQHDEMRGVRYSDPAVLRKRLELEKDKNVELRKKLSELLIAGEKCAKGALKERELAQRAVAAKHFPTVCDCTRCIAAVAEVAEVVGREVDETLEAFFPLELSSTTGGLSTTTAHQGDDLRCQMTKTLLKERRRAVKLRIRRTQFGLEEETLDAQLERLGYHQFVGNNNHESSKPGSLQHSSMDNEQSSSGGEKRIHDLLHDTALVDDHRHDEDDFDSREDGHITDADSAAALLSASTLPPIVQCIEKYRSCLLKMVNHRHVQETCVRDAHLLEGLGTVAARLAVPLEVLSVVASQQTD